MDTLQVVVLALIQGLTEFLPVSSSAHLLLPAQLLGWPDQGLAFDVAVHFGSLLAVLLYFRRDFLAMADSSVRALGGAPVDDNARLVFLLFIATIPAGVLGFIFNDAIEANMRGAEVIATSTLVFALLLAWSEYKGKKNRSMSELAWRAALIIGLFQALALMPGTSRSGITMTAALLLGFQRDVAARFSFFMSAPIILASVGLKSLQITAMPAEAWMSLLLGTAVAAVSAYACIGVFLRLLERIGFMPFVWYRIFLACTLFVLIAFDWL